MVSKLPSSPNNSLRPRGKRLGGPPARIGFIVDWLQDTYQTEVLRGAYDLAKERGVSLVVLPGGVIDAEHDHGRRRNPLYRLVSDLNFDALVVMTGTLGNVKHQDIAGTLGRDFPPERICSVGIADPKTSSVLVDNHRGVFDAVNHLIEDHGRTRIAFIRGPKSNEEAEIRFQAYCDALETAGIPYREELVVQGDFRREAGLDAIRELLDVRKLRLEELNAIVSADDSMALAALEELKARKISVPHDIAVVGYDDLEESRYATPPLASVRQPLRDQGREAMRLVLAALSTPDGSEQKTLATTQVRRRSCGCIPESNDGASDRPPASVRLDLEASLIRRRELILAEITRATRGVFASLGRGWEVRLFNALQDEFRGKPDSFRGAFDHVLEQGLGAGADLSVANNLVSALRGQLNLCAGDDSSRLGQVESLLHDARILASDVVERAQAQRRLSMETAARKLAFASAKLVGAFGAPRLLKAMSEQLPVLGLQRCYIVRCSGIDDEPSEFLVGFGPEGSSGAQAEPEKFDSARLLPVDVLDRDEPVHLVVQPLVYEEEYLGHVVLSLSDVEGYVFEVLGEVLSTAMKRLSAYGPA